MASHPLAHPTRLQRNEDSGALVKIVALFLGLAVGVLAIVAVWMGASAQNARDDARKAAASAPASAGSSSMPGMAMTGSTTTEGATATPSFAGIAPTNADALAAAHRAYPAELPAASAGPVVNVHLGINHRVLTIAPGIEYQAWAFGNRVPGPVIHARQGQTVRVTLTNNAPMPHSVDFHAARVAPNQAFVDIAPGKSFTFSFKVNDPGVFMYHCGTKPVLAHIANGMYGAIVVDPANPKLLPPVHHSYVLVSGEWYLNAPGDKRPAALDTVKARQMTPDWVTWNGYAAQYVKHPLTAHPGHTVRFYVVDAGPSLDTDFHVVGTVLQRAGSTQG
jgi:nitrite reductase (NO-forming)